METHGKLPPLPPYPHLPTRTQDRGPGSHARTAAVQGTRHGRTHPDFELLALPRFGKPRHELCVCDSWKLSPRPRALTL
jgi:hypothetical protein